MLSSDAAEMNALTALSSTKKTVLPRAEASAAAEHGQLDRGRFGALGSIRASSNATVNTLPRPTALFTRTLPPIACASCREIARPKPVPP